MTGSEAFFFFFWRKTPTLNLLASQLSINERDNSEINFVFVLIYILHRHFYEILSNLRAHCMRKAHFKKGSAREQWGF